ncbi:hypothetical protein PMAG_a0827 [Pseudoalteromonas mariniglutinosa NCIMB 1770]|nr:hypothetical protein [Pseudoalteromonas mariniglutinosa NCIMB 1770]
MFTGRESENTQAVVGKINLVICCTTTVVIYPYKNKVLPLTL